MDRVYVGNLPPDIRIKDIDDFFRPFGKLIYIDVNHRANPVYAYVQFDSARNAFNAVKARHGYDYEGYTLQMRLVENEVRRRRDTTPPPPPPPMFNDYGSNSNNNRLGGNSYSSFQTNSNQWSNSNNNNRSSMDYSSNNRSNNIQQYQNMSSYTSAGGRSNNSSNRSNMLQQYGNNNNNSGRSNMNQDSMNYSSRNMMNYSNSNRFDMSQQQQNMNAMAYSNNTNSSNWVVGNNESWNNANNNSYNNGNNSWNNGNNSWNNGNNSWNNGNNSWTNGNNNSWNNGNNNSWNNANNNSWNNANNSSWNNNANNSWNNNGNNNSWSGGNNNMNNMGWNKGNNDLDVGNNFNNNTNSYVYNPNNDPYAKSSFEDKYTAGLSGSGRKWFNRYIRKGLSPEMARAKALEHRTVPYLREPPANIPNPNDPTNAALETIGNTILSLLNTSGNVDNFNNVNNMMPGNGNWVGDFQGPSTSNARGGGSNKPPARNPISRESYLKSLNFLRRNRDKRVTSPRDRIARRFHAKIVSDYERFEKANTSSKNPSLKSTKTYAEMTVSLRKKKQQLLTSARRLERDPSKRSGPEYRKRMKILINEHGFPEIEARSLAVHPMRKLESLLAMKAECDKASSTNKSSSNFSVPTKKRPNKKNIKDRAYRNDINYLRMYETHKFSTITPRVRTALRLCLDRIHKHEREANLPLTKTKFSRLLAKVDAKATGAKNKNTTAGSKKTPAKKNTKKNDNDKNEKKSKDSATDDKSQVNAEQDNENQQGEGENQHVEEENQHDEQDNAGEKHEDADNADQEQKDGEEQDEEE